APAMRPPRQQRKGVTHMTRNEADARAAALGLSTWIVEAIAVGTTSRVVTLMCVGFADVEIVLGEGETWQEAFDEAMRIMFGACWASPQRPVARRAPIRPSHATDRLGAVTVGARKSCSAAGRSPPAGAVQPAVTRFCASPPGTASSRRRRRSASAARPRSAYA